MLIMNKNINAKEKAKNKIDICDIPIALILDQYMEYLSMMEKMDMDIAGEFASLGLNLGTGRLAGVNSMIRFFQNL